MAIVLLICTISLSLLSAVVTSKKDYKLRKILTNRSFYIFLSLNFVFTALFFSAVYADFFALLSGITVIKTLVCLALSAFVACSPEQPTPEPQPQPQPEKALFNISVQEDKLAFDPDRTKRRKFYDEVIEAFFLLLEVFILTDIFHLINLHFTTLIICC